MPFVPSALAIASEGQLLLSTTAATKFGAGWRALVNRERVDSLAVRPDGKRWAGLTPTGSVVFWHPGSPQSVSIDRAGAKAFAYDPQGEFLVTARTGSIEFHDVDFAFESLGSRALPCTGENTALALSTKRRLAIGCEGAIFLWDLPSIKNLRNSPGKRTIDLNVTLLVFHPTDPLRVAVAKPDGGVEVINVQTGDRRLIDRSECGSSLASQLVTMGSAALDREVASLKWSRSDQLTIVQKNGEIWTADTNSAKGNCEPRFLGGRTCQFALSTDGTWQAAIVEIADRSAFPLAVDDIGRASNTRFRTWSSSLHRCNRLSSQKPRVGRRSQQRAENLDTRLEWQVDFSKHRTLRCAPDCRCLQRASDWLAASGGNGRRNGYLWLWRTNSPKAQARIYTLSEASIESLALSPQGAVAAALSDGTVSRWTLDDLDGRPMRLGGTSGLMDDWNPSVQLEKAANWARVLGPVMVTPSDVDAMAVPKRSTYLRPAYNADGSLFAAVSGERIQILETDARGLAEQVCQLSPSNFTRQDWVRFVGAGEPYELTCPNRPVHPSLLAEADREAVAGRDREALLLYREIRHLQGASGLDPDRRLGGWKDRRQITDNIKPDREGLVKALDAWSRFAGSTQQTGVPPLSFEETLRLCRWSILLTGDGKDALPVCESAVEFLPDMMAIDSRGMARALTSDWKGALSDFAKSADYLTDPGWRKEHATWIEELQVRRNPITVDVRQRIAADELSR